MIDGVVIGCPTGFEIAVRSGIEDDALTECSPCPKIGTHEVSYSSELKGERWQTLIAVLVVLQWGSPSR